LPVLIVVIGGVVALLIILQQGQAVAVGIGGGGVAGYRTGITEILDFPPIGQAVVVAVIRNLDGDGSRAGRGDAVGIDGDGGDGVVTIGDLFLSF
jgi:hypothetical protein